MWVDVRRQTVVACLCILERVIGQGNWLIQVDVSDQISGRVCNVRLG